MSRKRKSRPVRGKLTGRQRTKNQALYPLSILHQAQVNKSPSRERFTSPLDKQWERGTPSEASAIIVLRKMQEAGLVTVHRIGCSVYGEMSELKRAFEVAGL